MVDKGMVVADIIDEIKQDEKEERQAQLWKTYGSYVITAAIAIVVGTAASVWWQGNQAQQAQSQGDALYSAITSDSVGDSEASLKALEGLTNSSIAVTAAMAQLKKATVLENSNETEKALSAYDVLTNSKNAPKEFKDYASLRYGMLAIESFDDGNSASADDIFKRLETLSAQDAVWRFSALETAAFFAYKQGNISDAERYFTQLADDANTPNGIRQRAREMADAIAQSSATG